ncbi:MAG: hypothetical protein JRE28_10405 [Deltaproteobacteria bacterium]|nr:hypothetical protein [Deltaproteobacteria bacterium]
MAEPTSALLVYDLVKEVALAAEIGYYGTTGNEEAMIPTDRSDLDRCIKVVNDAVRHFIAHGPVGGWRWRNRMMEVDLVRSYTGTATAGTATTLTDSGLAAEYADDFFNTYKITITAGTGEGEYATVTDYTGATGVFAFTALSGGSTPDDTSEYRICRSLLVIDSDPARYLLSQDFQGQTTGQITFAADQNAAGIEWTSEHTIRRNREIDVRANGAPFVAAVRPNATQRRWELIVDPEPNDETTIVFPYKASFDKLTMLSGTATAAGATSLTDSTLANLYPDDYFNDETIKVISGTGKYSYAPITDYAGATGEFTVADWLSIDGTAGGTDAAASAAYYVETDDVHPAGMQFDDAILSACRAFTEQEFADVDRGYMGKYLQSDLPAAYVIDARSVPRKAGVMRSGSGPRVTYLQRPIVTYGR